MRWIWDSDMPIPNDRQSIHRQIGELREKLLDLTGRNKLLNFKPIYASKDGKRRIRNNVVQITDELPEQVFSRLVSELRQMSFKSAKADHDDRLAGYEELAEGGYGGDLPDSRHTDAYLQTTHTASDLEKRLYQIYLEARSVFEEQGYRVLYLSLGLLEYRETEQSEERWLAPLVLIPVDLQRPGVGKPYKLVYTEDEIFPNISLAARLRRGFDVQLPEYPEQAEEMSVDAYYAEVKEAVRRKPGWRVLTDIYLGFFSFHKFVMWKDLDPASWPEGEAPHDHPLLAGAIAGEGNGGGGEAFDLSRIDELLPAHKTFHLLDADPSQIAVIEDIKAGHSLVVQGPPGTGKSQTIANTIAELLALGKRVLFVSEKMAALEVVKARLDNCGMGSFCLELHSHKANKRQVLAQLREAMAAVPPGAGGNEQDLAALEKRKSQLNDYALALRSRIGESGLSTYQAFGVLEAANALLESLGQSDILHKQNSLADLDAEAVQQASEALGLVATCLHAVHPVAGHPWRGLRPPGFKPDQEELVEGLRETASSLADVDSLLGKLEAVWGVAYPAGVEQIAETIDTCRFLRQYPQADERLLTGALWNQPPAEAEALIAQLAACQDLIGFALASFKATALEAEVERTLAALEKGSRSWPSRWFDREFRSARRSVQGWYCQPAKRGVKQVVEDLRALAKAVETRAELREQSATAFEVFGSAWRAEASDARQLRRLAEWLSRYRHQIVEGRLTERSAAAVRKPDGGELSNLSTKLQTECENLTAGLNELRRKLQAEDGLFEGALPSVQARVASLIANAGAMADWARYLRGRDDCCATAGGPALETFERVGAKPDSLRPAFDRSLCLALLRRAFSEHPVLMNFTARTHEELIAEFVKLDREVMVANRTRLYRLLHSRRATEMEELAKQGRLVKHETGKTRAHKPIRRLLREAGQFVQALKPCMMMSPLSVAQYLAPESIRFDIVIFDEASQVRPEDALGALTRADQAVVVGDSKQMPPTSFFDRVDRDDAAASDEEFEDEPEVKAGEHESILQMCQLSLEERMLNWHYRSRHESLISLANDRFYGGRLRVFPSNAEAGDGMGLQHISSAGTYYETGKGENAGEARLVAEAVYRHYQSSPETSLGVGAFGIRQQSSIQLALEQIVRETHDHDFEQWVRSGPEGRNEPCFVKNLETIQGDERDTIFVSVGYGKDSEGKLLQRFGPINNRGGERRLNVLITRARQHCKVFCNFTADELRIQPDSAEGLRCLREFLHYAETGKLELHQSAGLEAESPFEQAVEQFLRHHNFDVLRQYGSGTYRIDLVVMHRDRSTRLAGIECDGAAYHGTYNARERDRQREQLLRDRGWEIVRVWSTDWFRSPQQAKARLLSQLETLEKRSAATSAEI